MFNHIIAEAIREYLAGQRRDGHSSALAFKNVTKIFEVRVAASDSAVFEFESRNVCSTNNLIIRIHGSRRAMCHRVLHLVGGGIQISSSWANKIVDVEHETDFHFQKVFRRAVDFFKALLASIGHCLHAEGL